MSMNITVFTSPTCSPCKIVKYFLEKNKISYTERSVAEESNMTEAIKKSGGMTVPVIDVDGRIIVGPNLPLLREALML